MRINKGYYNFRVRSRNVYGTIGDEATYQFAVLPPLSDLVGLYPKCDILNRFYFTYTRYRFNKHKIALAKERLLIEKLKHTDHLKDTVFETGLDYYYRKDFTGAASSFKEVLNTIPGDKAAQLYLRRSAEFMVQGAPGDWTGWN